jgi:hypothetical protein
MGPEPATENVKEAGEARIRIADCSIKVGGNLHWAPSRRQKCANLRKSPGEDLGPSERAYAVEPMRVVDVDINHYIGVLRPIYHACPCLPMPAHACS